MNRDELVQNRRPSWDRLAELLRSAEHSFGPKRLGADGIREFAALYRSLASDLMRVRRDRLGTDLERYLDNLASRAHNVLYADTAVGNSLRFRDLIFDFAPALRRNLHFFGLAVLLFFGSGVIAGLAAYSDESYALAILSPSQLEGMEQMHSKGHADGRAANDAALMTGFYIFNNIGIAFRCFSTGILFGLGPVFFLLFNGLNIGVTFGHLIRLGHGENILSFASTHGPWELIAIVISGAAGLQMGFSLVSTKGRTRIGNLRAHGLELLRQIIGAGFFLAIAAVLEAWYSPSSLSPMIKYLSGGVSWILVIWILAGAGRDRAVPKDVEALATTQPPKGAST